MLRADKARNAPSFGKIFGYLAALALTVIFALFLSGRTGWFFFSVMTVLPLTSVISAAVMRRYITVSADVSENRLYKGEAAVYTVTAENRALIPAPPIIAELEVSSALECGVPSGVCEINVLPRSEEKAEVAYTARLWYPTEIKLRALYIKDYTGLFRFPLKTDIPPAEIDIIPDIVQIPAAGDLMKSVSEASQGDDSEDSSDQRAVGFTGVPGYEYREYTPGDPIKRINWKLSCRRDDLMVRLDDALVSSKHTFILDPVNSGKSAEGAERCGETMLGCISAVIATGYSAELMFFKKGWQVMSAEDENDIEQLRLALAGYRFSEDAVAERVPYKEMADQEGRKSASVLFFSPCYDKALSTMLRSNQRISKTDTAVITAASAVENGVDPTGIWLISNKGTIDFIQ